MAHSTEDFNSKSWVYLYTVYYEVVFKLEANQIKIHPAEAREFDMMHNNEKMWQRGTAFCFW